MSDDRPEIPSSGRTPDLASTLAAVALLLDVERLGRITGRAVVRTWAHDPFELRRPPAVAGFHVDVDHRERRWSLRHDARRFVDEMSGAERRYLIRDHVEAVDPDLEWPDVIRLLHPVSALDIWGRASDGWRLVGAWRVDDHYVLSAAHVLCDASRTEILVDAVTGVPTRWTTTLVLGATIEIVLTDVEVHGGRPERIISTATEPGECMAFPPATEDEPRWWED